MLFIFATPDCLLINVFFFFRLSLFGIGCCEIVWTGQLWLFCCCFSFHFCVFLLCQLIVMSDHIFMIYRHNQQQNIINLFIIFITKSINFVRIEHFKGWNWKRAIFFYSWWFVLFRQRVWMEKEFSFLIYILKGFKWQSKNGKVKVLESRWEE